MSDAINTALVVHLNSMSQTGISVSNAGGFHGSPNFFGAGECQVSHILGQLCSQAVQLVEDDDFLQSRQPADKGSSDDLVALKSTEDSNISRECHYDAFTEESEDVPYNCGKFKYDMKLLLV